MTTPFLLSTTRYALLQSFIQYQTISLTRISSNIVKGSHSGTMDISGALDKAVTTLPVDFTGSALSKYTHGFGYPGMSCSPFEKGLSTQQKCSH